MPVLNVDIAETIEITSNGQHDVAKYTTADVNVPKVINSLPITPSTSAQTFTATGGVDGYSPVTVSAVTAAIDANITAGNIKKDVQILGVTGTYEGGGSALTLQYGNSSGTLTKPTSAMDLTGITTIPDNGMLNLFFNNNNLVSQIDYSNITTVGNQAFYATFQSCTHLTGIDLSGITTINSEFAFQYCFDMCWSLTSANFNGLTTIGSAASGCFSSAFSSSALTSVDFSALQSVAGDSAFYSAFMYCGGLTSVSFPSLQTITGAGVFYDAFFWCSSLTSLSFPALLSNFFGDNYNEQFTEMLYGVTGCTVHFPSNLQAVIGNEQDVLDGFSGTNTTVLFDLPATA